MIYFKKKCFETEEAKANTEDSIRRFASKRHISIEFQASSTDNETDKLFIGVEGKNDVKFTRIRSLPEKVLPKLIISFPNGSKKSFYRVRLSILSSVFFMLIASQVLFNLYKVLFEGHGSYMALSRILIIIAFVLTSYFELKLTERAIRNAVAKCR